MKCKVAIFGAGTIGGYHVEAAQAAGAGIGYVVDTKLDSAQRLAETCDAIATADADQVWNDQQITAVVIAVPNRFHEPIAVAAMHAGKDVLLEKPMGRNVAECDQIIQAAESTGRVLQIGMVHRYTAVGESATQIVQSGQLGDVYHVKAHLYQRRGVPGLGGWFTNRAISGGGVLIDLGVHLIDLALSVTKFPEIEEVRGQVYSVFGRRMRDYTYESMWAGPPNFDGVCDVEDAAHAFIRCRQGMTIDLHVTWAGNFPKGSMPGSMMGFFGDQAGITFELFGDCIRMAKEQEGRNIDVSINLPPKLQFHAQMADFLRATETRQMTGPSPEQARIVQSIIDTIYASSINSEPRGTIESSLG